MGPSGSCRSRGLHPKAPSLGRTRLHSPECRPPKTAGLKSGSCLLCYPMPRKNRVDQTDRKRLFLRGSRFPVTGLRIMTRERGCVEYGREERGKAPWTRLGAGRQSPQPHAGTLKGPQGNATADTKKPNGDSLEFFEWWWTTTAIQSPIPNECDRPGNRWDHGEDRREDSNFPVLSTCPQRYCVQQTPALWLPHERKNSGGLSE